MLPYGASHTCTYFSQYALHVACVYDIIFPNVPSQICKAGLLWYVLQTTSEWFCGHQFVWQVATSWFLGNQENKTSMYSLATWYCWSKVYLLMALWVVKCVHLVGAVSWFSVTALRSLKAGFPTMLVPVTFSCSIVLQWKHSVCVIIEGRIVGYYYRDKI